MLATLKQVVTSDGLRSSGWLFCAPLLAAYAPRDLPKMYFNLHLRRYARRLVPLLDPFVTVDILSKSCRSGQPSRPSHAYEEVKEYLMKMCSRDVLEFCAEGTVDGTSFSLGLSEGQEVADHFHGVTVWWLVVPPTRRTTMMSEEVSCLRLMFPQRHRALILDEYLPHVRRTGRRELFASIDITVSNRMFDPMVSATDDDELKSSAALREVKAYLSRACWQDDVLELRAEGTVRDDTFFLSLREGEEVPDRFRDVNLWWSSLPKTNTSIPQQQPEGCLRLTFPQRHRTLILDDYLPHVRREGRKLMSANRRQRLYTNKRSYGSSWSHVDFEHPATFDTLAMPPAKKRRIMDDLDSFLSNKDYYCRIGKPWKRGYLLYGPPGTGKSTMIAAMANYLNYDIYDVDLTSVMSNSDLRDLFINVTGKSVIVVEDIDRSFDDFTGQPRNKGKITIPPRLYPTPSHENRVTMSGLLNFIDGVWSAQSGEQIIVLTTNFPEKLDEALIRRGRMDMHVEMPYCCFETFKTLARNYLGGGAVDDELQQQHHALFRKVEELLQVVEITPADVAECLLPSQADVSGSNRGVETCLRCLIDELEKKKAQDKKAKGKLIIEDKAAVKPKRRRRHC